MARISAARRAIVLLSATGIGISIVVALRQLGVFRRLPDLPGKLFQANAITTSPAAYPLGVPDAIPAIALYATNIVAASGSGRWRRRLLALTAIGGAGAAAGYLHEMVVRQRRVCVYCL